MASTGGIVAGVILGVLFLGLLIYFVIEVRKGKKRKQMGQEYVHQNYPGREFSTDEHLTIGTALAKNPEFKAEYLPDHPFCSPEENRAAKVLYSRRVRY